MKLSKRQLNRIIKECIKESFDYELADDYQRIGIEIYYARRLNVSDLAKDIRGLRNVATAYQQGPADQVGQSDTEKYLFLINFDNTDDVDIPTLVYLINNIEGVSGARVLTVDDENFDESLALTDYVTSRQQSSLQKRAVRDAANIKIQKYEDMIAGSSLGESKKKGLWANIHAKRKRGEKSNPNSKGYKAAKKAGQKINKAAKRKKKNELDETNITEALDYHISNGYGVEKNIFRPGSTAFFSLFREARAQIKSGNYIPSDDEKELLEELDIGEFAMYEGRLVPLDYPILYGTEEHLNEAEYKGKKVDLNKPKKGSDGAYVYVNSGKKNKDGTIKVKKVSFGSSMPDAMGDSEAHKKRRKNYGIRHKCAEKDDKTKPGYWSCRATKFFGRSIAGWW